MAKGCEVLHVIVVDRHRGCEGAPASIADRRRCEATIDQATPDRQSVGPQCVDRLQVGADHRCEDRQQIGVDHRDRMIVAPTRDIHRAITTITMRRRIEVAAVRRRCERIVIHAVRVPKPAGHPVRPSERRPRVNAMKGDAPTGLAITTTIVAREVDPTPTKIDNTKKQMPCLPGHYRKHADIRLNTSVRRRSPTGRPSSFTALSYATDGRKWKPHHP